MKIYQSNYFSDGYMTQNIFTYSFMKPCKLPSNGGRGLPINAALARRDLGLSPLAATVFTTFVRKQYFI